MAKVTDRAQHNVQSERKDVGKREARVYEVGLVGVGKAEMNLF